MDWRDRDIEELLMAAGVGSSSQEDRHVMKMVLREHDYRLRETTMKFDVGGQVLLVDVHQWMEELSPVVRDAVERRVMATAVVAQIAQVGERTWLGVVPGLAIRESADNVVQLVDQVRDEVRRVREMRETEFCRLYVHWAYTPLEVQHVQDYYDLVDGVHFEFDEATTSVADNG